MIRIGLLSAESNSFHYGSKKKRGNHSKTYRYYYDNELLIKAYCQENGINIFKIQLA